MLETWLIDFWVQRGFGATHFMCNQDLYQESMDEKI